MGDLELAAKLLADYVQHDVELAPFTTYKLGGPAKLFIEAKDEEVLKAIEQAVIQSDIDVLVIGKGSNMLVSDNGFDGLVITLGGEFTEIEFEDTYVTAGGAVSLPVLARKTVAEGLTGFEWAVGVPGSVGGAVRMNAGGHGSQTSETIVRYRMIDLRGGPDGDKSYASLGHSYRRSTLQPWQVVTSATLQLAEGIKEDGEQEIADIVKWRRENQPGGRNAGSVFTNPEGNSAGALIDAAGMKGTEMGSATVSPKHANFIQSTEGGTAADVLALIKQVRTAVQANSGIELKPEVRLVGFTTDELGELA